MTDAKFEDGGEGPLRLVAQDAEDLKVISTLIQDAVPARSRGLAFSIFAMAPLIGSTAALVPIHASGQSLLPPCPHFRPRARSLTEPTS